MAQGRSVLVWIFFGEQSLLFEDIKPQIAMKKAEVCNAITKHKKVPWLCSQRIALAVIGLFGFINVYALRINLSVGIVCMVNHTALNEGINITETKSEQCSPGEANTTNFVPENGELNWSKPLQGLVLGSFYWGYVITQLPAGWLSTRIGGKRIIGWSMFICAAVNLLMPVAARTHPIFLIVLRVIAGAAQGSVYVTILSLWAYWAPPLERSYLVGLPFAGAHMGNVILIPLSGLLCKYGFAGGWPSIFYVTGSAGIVWFLCWMYIVYDTPEKHPRISSVEREYIQDSLRGHTKKTINAGEIPWRSIFQSPAVWALITANITVDWTIHTFMTNLPTYMKEILQFNIQENTLLSCLPFLAVFVVSVTSAFVADKLRSAKIMTTTTVRKTGNTLGMIVSAIVLIALGYIDCSHKFVAVVLLISALGFVAIACGSGFGVNHTDIAPKYASIIFGFANGLAAITGFLAPTLIGYITKDKTQAQWRIVFFISAAITTFGAVFYLLAGSGELQKWAKDEPEEEEESYMMENKVLEETKGE